MTTASNSSALSIDGPRLLQRIRQLGATGRSASGALSRVTASDEDKAARDLFVSWIRQSGLEVTIDAVGNILGRIPGGSDEKPIMIGSHLDTVIDAGMYDGAYGVLSALSVLEALKAGGISAAQRPVMLAAFTNEEGVRYHPDMMGSLVFTGGYSLEAALTATGTDGSKLGQELARIGYAGTANPGAQRPVAYLELHIEQGPILDTAGIAIGAVENLQGISWQRITIEGVANHAGTTPQNMRADAGQAAARLINFLRDDVMAADPHTVATVGTIHFEPNAVNVIPGRAILTIDLRDPEDGRLHAADEHIAAFFPRLEKEFGVKVSSERLLRFPPVVFDPKLVERIERAAEARGLSHRRMTSGAGHDAQMMARICPTAMIFIPSKGGISHSPRERSEDTDVVAGANILLDVVAGLQREMS